MGSTGYGDHWPTHRFQQLLLHWPTLQSGPSDAAYVPRLLGSPSFVRGTCHALIRHPYFKKRVSDCPPSQLPTWRAWQVSCDFQDETKGEKNIYHSTHFFHCYFPLLLLQFDSPQKGAIRLLIRSERKTTGFFCFCQGLPHWINRSFAQSPELFHPPLL